MLGAAMNYLLLWQFIKQLAKIHGFIQTALQIMHFKLHVK